MNSLSSQPNDLKEKIGEAVIITDIAECQYFSQDVFSAGKRVVAVLQPTSQQQLVEMIRYCYQKDIAILPRGGGLSYTSGYLNQSEKTCVCLDTTGLNQILEINETDRFVRVEPGVTWAQLSETLKALNLRTPFWGTLSGLEATIGAGISQNCLFFGSADSGISAESVLGIKAIIADGEILHTGCYLKGQQQAIRFFGPDLCGLLTGDCGALGIKSEICLRLVPIPRYHQGFSFGFEHFEPLFDMVGKIQRAALVSECVAFDPVLQQQRMKRTSLTDDLSKFGQVLQQSESLTEMVKNGVKIAKAGRKFLDQVNYSLHCVVEADSEPALKQKSDALKDLVSNSGKEIENTIPVVIRSNPFTPPTSMVGPEGERWVPVHGVFRYSQASVVYQKLLDFFAARETEMAAHQIVVGYLMTPAGTNGFLIEPVFYWPDELLSFHQRRLPKSYLQHLKTFSPNLAAREKVTQWKQEVTELMDANGATHFQIGKFYAYRERLDPASAKLIKAIKQSLDPKGLINPGALGLY